MEIEITRHSDIQQHVRHCRDDIDLERGHIVVNLLRGVDDNPRSPYSNSAKHRLYSKSLKERLT